MKAFIPLVVLVLISGSSCGQKTFEEKMQSLYKHTVPQIKSEELKERQDQVVILDTRNPQEFEVSHLAGARMIDYDDFEIEQVIDIAKDAEIIVYCSVGYRSERIGEQLLDAGYKNVRNLYGGIFDWKNNGHQVVNSANQPTDSVHTYNNSWGKWLYKGIKVN